MPFDPDQDKKLKEWKSEETGLIVSINQYGNAQPKVQIGPRMLKKKDGTDRAPSKAGRLNLEDMEFLYGIIDEVKEELESRIKPE
jgi:hypothetical protein